MKALDILYNHNLKRTSCREGIIDIVKNAKQALSENEIRERLTGKYNRTTFYRSFKTLVEHKIIHKIIVDNQMVKYALSNFKILKNEHIHFFCNECNTVKCLNHIPVQKYQLPEGYVDAEIDVVIKGKCSNCKNQLNN